MPQDEYEIQFYEKEDGSKPVKDFILSLPPKEMAKTLRSIDILQKNGPALREPYSKHLSDDIFELRIKFGNNISRVLYFFYVGKRIVLTNGFVKKTQKTPKSEIEKAKKYKSDYISKQK